MQGESELCGTRQHIYAVFSVDMDPTLPKPMGLCSLQTDELRPDYPTHSGSHRLRVRLFPLLSSNPNAPLGTEIKPLEED